MTTVDFRDYDPAGTRKDIEYRAAVVARRELSDRFNLLFSWQLDRNDSNQASFDYHRQVFDLALQYNYGGGTGESTRRRFLVY